MVRELLDGNCIEWFDWKLFVTCMYCYILPWTHQFNLWLVNMAMWRVFVTAYIHTF